MAPTKRADDARHEDRTPLLRSSLGA